MSVKKRKRIFALVIVLVILLLYLKFGTGHIYGVHENIEKSDTYTENDIKGAMNAVKFYFFFLNRGCTLKNLWYDEEQSLPVINEMKSDGKISDIKNAIVIMSDFDPGNTGRTDGDGYSWLLTRIGNTGFWKIDIFKSGQG